MVKISLDSEIESFSQEISEKLKDNVGKQVLVVRQEISPVKHYIMAPQSRPYIRDGPTHDLVSVNRNLKLGILKSSLEVNVNEGNIILPMGNYVAKNDKFPTSIMQWNLKEGSIILNWLDCMYLRDETTLREENSLVIYSGEMVEQYFRTDQFG
ncbi:hypothetical protein K8R47_00140, partial [archaeon]|nr:hypothetical protein [archaeon]